MSQKFILFPNTAGTQDSPINSESKQFQSLKFSAATRRIPLLVFLTFLAVAVMVAGALAHNRTTWQAFWNQEAVLDRHRVLSPLPLGIFFDSLVTRINRIFVRGGWILAGTLIVLVQVFYLFLVRLKRDRTPSLRFIRTFNLKETVAIEVGVLLSGTAYFLFCTWSFNWISDRIGSCTEASGAFKFPSSGEACANGTFRGFDISGHCFLIVHSCLLALEYAAKLLFVWHAKERPPSSFTDKDSDIESLSDQVVADSEDSIRSNDFFNRNLSLLQFLIVVLLSGVFFLCLAEFLVFLQTILFYHTVLEKILGTFIGAWFWIALFILSLKYPHLF